MQFEVNKVRLTVLIALLFSALCAGVFRTPPILFMAALLCSAPVVGIIIGSIGSRGLRLMRRLPESGMVGDIIAGEILIRNAAWWPAFLVHARGSQPDKKRAQDAKTQTPPLEALAPYGDDEWVAPFLRGQENAVWKQQWVLQKRGIHQLAPSRAGALDPLGLYNRLPARSASHQIVVMPRPVRIEQLGFLGGVDAASPVPRHSTTVSDATDFHGVRPWQPGETIRRAHWKSTARTGKLHVIEWEETPTADLAILLDTQSQCIVGDDVQNTLESSITAAASVACHLLENGCRVQLFFYLPAEETGAGRKGKAAKAAAAPARPVLQRLQARSVLDMSQLLRALAEITPVRHIAGSLSQLVEDALPQVQRGMGVVLLASARADLAQAMVKAEAGLAGANCSALAFEAQEPGEREEARQAGKNGTAARVVQAAVPAAKARKHTASRSAGRRQRQAIATIHAEDALAAALEQTF